MCKCAYLASSRYADNIKSSCDSQAPARGSFSFFTEEVKEEAVPERTKSAPLLSSSLQKRSHASPFQTRILKLPG